MQGSKTREIRLNYIPRAWQETVHRTRPRFCTVTWPRRAGKTAFAIAELVHAALQKSGALLAYVAPTRSQAKQTVWQRLKDFARPVPGVAFFEQELRCVFPNGSTVLLAGALDGGDALRGVGLDGAVCDEYALMADEVFGAVLRPALSDRQGWCVFISTPRGRDPLWRLIEATRDLDGWRHYHATAVELQHLPPGELEAARQSMSEDAFLREFMCSFDAAPPGSIFGRYLAALRAAGRITPSIPWLDGVDTWAALDLGIADATSAWVGQSVGGEHRILLHKEWTGTALADVGKTLKDLGVRTLFAPHDVKVRDLFSGRSRIEALESMGFYVEVAPRVSLEEGIAATAALFPHLVFDEKYTAQGIDRLGMYRRDTDDRHGGYGPPVHDIASHAADALRYLALCLSDRPAPAFRDPQTNRVWSEPRTLTCRSSSGAVQTITLRKDR